MDLPVWLSKAQIKALRGMEIDDALEELTRIISERKEKRSLYMKEWHSKNPGRGRERHTELARIWRRENRDKDRAAQRRYRENRSEESKAHRREIDAERRRLGLKKRDNEAHKIHNQRYRQKTKLVRALQDDPSAIKATIARQLPAYLSPFARMDIVNSVIEAILARKIMYDELQGCAKQFVAAYNRQFDYFKNLSIDAPIAGTDGLTRGDMLSNDTPHF